MASGTRSETRSRRPLAPIAACEGCSAAAAGTCSPISHCWQRIGSLRLLGQDHQRLTLELDAPARLVQQHSQQLLKRMTKEIASHQHRLIRSVGGCYSGDIDRDARSHGEALEYIGQRLPLDAQEDRIVP